jgi:hypothetical protein
VPQNPEAAAMPTPTSLLNRLDAIGAVLRERGDALALLGLGSVGADTWRLDEHSDLDFFVVVDPGRKRRYVDALDWLAAAHPLAWSFRNTADGHKALMSDGVFCEFAVFEPDELAHIPYAPGRLVWARADADPAWTQPRRALPPAALPDEAWIVGEALSCLLIGLKRWHRGERLSAARFVQGHAVDRLIELDALRGRADRAGADPFNRERRLEARQPALATELPRLVPGYAHTPAAALAVLAALQRRGAALNEAMVVAIRQLVGAPGQPTGA